MQTVYSEKPGWLGAGLLFLGMLHSMERYLNPDVKVIYPLHRPR